MGAENLGYLAQFLGGMQQGKLLKQKKELSAAQLEARKAEAEQRKFDRASTASYREQQLALQRANLGATLAKNERDALGLDDMMKLGTSTRDKIAGVVAARSKELDEAPTPADYRKRLDAIRATVDPDIQTLKTLARDPNIAKKFPGFKPEQIESVWLSGIPEYAKNPNVDYGEPDYKARYKPTDAKYQFNLNIEKLRKANIQAPEAYANALLPAYQKIMADLEGVPDAARYAWSTLGNIPGYSMDQTLYMLETGRMPQLYSTPEQMNVTGISGDDTGGVYDQSGLPLRFGNELMMGDPSTEAPQDLEYYQRAYPKLFDRNSYPDLNPKTLLDAQGQPNYERNQIARYPIGVDITTQTNAGLMDSKIKAANVKAEEARVGLPERLRKAALTNETLETRLGIMDVEKQKKVADAFMAQMKADNFDKILGADLNVKLTTALKNNQSVITGLKKWETEQQKQYGMAVTTAGGNLQKAAATFANNPNIAPYLTMPGVSAALTTYINDPSPNAVIPFNVTQTIGSGGVLAAANYKKTNTEYEKAVKARDDFNKEGILKTRSIMDRIINTVGGGTGSARFSRVNAGRPSSGSGASSGSGGGRSFSRVAPAAPPRSGGGGVNVERPQPN